MKIILALVFATAFAAAPALAQTVVVDSAACRALATHQPSPDVAYRPGVDVRGRPVVGADLNPAPAILPPTLSFDLNADLAPFLPAGSRLSLPQMGVGRVTIGPDGKVMFNGQPVGQGDGAALAAACSRAAPR
ncbi:MAG: hypothetical protein ACKOUS_04100 [Alphaproteobacteria bacterium]